MTTIQDGMHPEDIKAALRRRFGTLRAFCRQIRRDKTMVSHVLRNPCFSIPTEKAIAKALELSPHAIWPDRWTETGEPLPRTGEREPTRAASVETSQKRKAA